MGIFSKFRSNNKIHLDKSDFKTKKEESEVAVTFVSEKFLKLLPKLEKKEKQSEKSILNTNTASLLLFNDIVDISYDPTEMEIGEGKFISKINQTLNWIQNNESLINNGITNKLLKLKNESWLNKNEPQVSKNEFIKRIKLTSISFFGDGSSELIFDDGDNFWGHKIVADLSSENRFIDANIRG